MESMIDIDGNVVRVGDRVAFVTTGYSHRVNFRTGIVTKIRDGYNGQGAATVSYIDKNERWDYKTGKWNSTPTTRKCSMQLPRIALIK